MRIQAFQSPQMQNGQNFTANAVIQTPLPKLYEKLSIKKPHLVLKEGSSELIKHLRYIVEVLKDFSAVEGPKESGPFANVRHFISPAGDKAVLAKEGLSPERPIGIIINHSDGSETYIERFDWGFESSSESDTLFDEAAAVLNDKAIKPNKSSEVTLGENLIEQEAQRV